MGTDEKNKSQMKAEGKTLSLDMLRPAVEELAKLHRSGRVHGRICMESVVVRDHLWFTFPLSHERAEDWRGGKGSGPFVSLALSEAGGQGERENGDRDPRSAVYIPLEQLLGGGIPGPESDVYSMCAVLYQRLTGMKPPDVGSRIQGAELKRPSELGADISSAQENALMKGLEELAKNRHRDGAELCQALYGAENPEQQQEKPPAERGRLRSGWIVQENIADIEKLRKIVFVDYISEEAAGKLDVSEEGNRSVMAWTEEENGWNTLYIGSEGGVKAGTSCFRMFNNCKNLEEIIFGGNFDTRDVTDMSLMFCNCESLCSLNAEGLDTSNVTNMRDMFWNCESLRSLNVSGFDTSSVTDMGYMFGYCENLLSLDVSSFDTSGVNVVGGMFYGCGSLKELDVSGFDTSCATDMSDMFSHCENLRSLDISKFDTSHVTDMSGMFSHCENLRHLDVSGFVTSCVTNMSYMFSQCENLISLDVSGFDTSSVLKMGHMFQDCSGLEKLKLFHFDMSKVEAMDDMFKGTKWESMEPNAAAGEEKEQKPGGTLRSGWAVKKDIADIEKLRKVVFVDYISEEAAGKLDVSAEGNGSVMAWKTEENGWNTLYIGSEGGVKAGTSCREMFKDCENLEEIIFGRNFDTRDAVDMSWMFFNCRSLCSLEAEWLDTSGVTYMQGMFCSCGSLRGLDVSSFDTSSVKDMSWMFRGCGSLEELDVSGFNTSNVINMSDMFYECRGLTSLDVSGFDTSCVTDMANMFNHCESLRSLDISRFDTSHVTSMRGMFGFCKNLCYLDVSKFVTSCVKDMSFMFCQCENLISLDVSGFDTFSVEDMKCMFSGCKNLVDLDVSGFVTSRVRSMESMFSYCSSLKKLDLRHFDMSGVEDRTDMLEETPGVIWNLFDKIKWTFGKGKK